AATMRPSSAAPGGTCPACTRTYSVDVSGQTSMPGSSCTSLCPTSVRGLPPASSNCSRYCISRRDSSPSLVNRLNHARGTGRRPPGLGDKVEPPPLDWPLPTEEVALDVPRRRAQVLGVHDEPVDVGCGDGE